jgi:hypothetical protein
MGLAVATAAFIHTIAGRVSSWAAYEKTATVALQASPAAQHLHSGWLLQLMKVCQWLTYLSASAAQQSRCGRRCCSR